MHRKREMLLLSRSLNADFFLLLLDVFLLSDLVILKKQNTTFVSRLQWKRNTHRDLYQWVSNNKPQRQYFCATFFTLFAFFSTSDSSFLYDCSQTLYTDFFFWWCVVFGIFLATGFCFFSQLKLNHNHICSVLL